MDLTDEGLKAPYARKLADFTPPLPPEDQLLALGRHVYLVALAFEWGLIAEADELSPIPPGPKEAAPLYPARVALGVLRVRSGPGLEQPIVDRLAQGVRVEVWQEAGDWLRISRAGDPERWVAKVSGRQQLVVQE